MCCTLIKRRGVPSMFVHRMQASHHKSSLGQEAVKTSFVDCCDGTSISSSTVAATWLVLDSAWRSAIRMKEKERLRKE
jgi:hypothetical protein